MIIFYVVVVLLLIGASLQFGGMLPTIESPYFSAFMIGVIVVIIIAAFIAQRKDRQEKIKSKQNRL